MRKDPAEDEKVDAVAEALIKGKTGDKLEEEIKEQMVTRGEASESEEEARTSSGARRWVIVPSSILDLPGIPAGGEMVLVISTRRASPRC